MKWINDIMIPDVVTVEKGTHVVEAIEKLIKSNITGLPVVNNEDRIIGIISEKDVLALAIRLQENNFNPKQENMPVEDFMTKDVVTIEATESLASLCSCLMKNKFRRLPVMLNGKLVGIVTRRDVISYIFNMHMENQ